MPDAQNETQSDTPQAITGIAPYLAAALLYYKMKPKIKKKSAEPDSKK